MNQEIYERLRALEKLEKLKQEFLKLEKSEEKPQTNRKSLATYREREIEYLEENFYTFGDVYRLMLLKAGEDV